MAALDYIWLGIAAVFGVWALGWFINARIARARGRGLGRALLGRLEEGARRLDGHVMVAGVSSANTAGRAFHAAEGYAEGAVLPEVGWKFGRWLDLHLMTKRL